MPNLLFNQKLSYDTKCRPSIHFLNTKGQPLGRKCPIWYIRSTCNNANTSVSDVNPNATSSVTVSFIQLKRIVSYVMVVGACIRCMFCRPLAVGYCTVDGCYRLESCHILFWNWLSKIQLVLVLPSQTAPGFKSCMTPPDTWFFNVVWNTLFGSSTFNGHSSILCSLQCSSIASLLLHWCSSSLRMLTPFWQLGVRSQALGLSHNLQKKTALVKMFELGKPLFISVKVFLVNNTLERSKTAGILC